MSALVYLPTTLFVNAKLCTTVTISDLRKECGCTPTPTHYDANTAINESRRRRNTIDPGFNRCLFTTTTLLPRTCLIVDGSKTLLQMPKGNQQSIEIGEVTKFRFHHWLTRKYCCLRNHDRTAKRFPTLLFFPNKVHRQLRVLIDRRHKTLHMAESCQLSGFRIQ